MKFESECSRKAKRKENRKNRKSEKHAAYQKYHSSKMSKVAVEKSRPAESSKKIKALKGMISAAKAEMKVNGNKKNTSSQKQVASPAANNGPVFTNALESRMAALQEFISNEIKESGGTIHGVKKKKKVKSLKSDEKDNKKGIKKNVIKDKNKLNNLEKGIEKDNHELNEIYRQLHFNAKQKKSNSMLRNVFGGDIGDIFDVLDGEPTEADLLSDQIILQPKLPNTRKKKLIEIPKNAMIINTKQAYFEQDKIPEGLDEGVLDSCTNLKQAQKRKAKVSSSDLTSSKRRKLLNSDNSDCSQKRVVPTVYEFEGLDETDTLKGRKKKTNIEIIQTVQNGPLKSIMKNKKKKKKKLNEVDRLSVSFDLAKNNVRLIPPIIKVSGFTVVDDALFYYEDDSEDSSVSVYQESHMQDEIQTEEFSDDDMDTDAYLLDSDESVYEDIETESQSDGEEFDMESVEYDDSSDDIDMEAEFSDSDLGDSEDSGHETEEQSSLTCNSKSMKVKNAASHLTEDIYGRLRDSSGKIVESSDNDKSQGSGYCSPEQRKQDAQLQEQLKTDIMKKVRTQLRGRLNRLAQLNLTSAITMVTALYSNHPRQLLNVVLSELLTAELVTGGGLTLDRHCQECALLVVATGANVAEEIGAHILTDFVVSWHSELQSKGSSVLLRNYIMFVTHLYNFGLVHAVLMFDMLHLLLNHFSATNVEQVIQIMGSVGFLLRKDQPLQLKDVIVKVQLESTQDNTNKIPQLELLHSMLRAIKNNNESKMPNYDPTCTEQLRKLLRTVVGDDGKMTPVRVTLEDLLLSETRGRWWVVGSAWTGASMLQDRTSASAHNKNKLLAESKNNFSDTFLKFSENMRITRPPKINILFALTVGSADTDESFSKLLDLSLPPSQEKLIFDVMLFCIQKMKAYKAFYSLLCTQLCNHDPKYRRLLQHSLWDKFSDFDDLKSRELRNLARFVIDIVKADSLNLSLLKTLPLAETNEKIASFLQDVFYQLFDAKEGCHVSYNAFQKLFKSKKLSALRKQFKLFLIVFIVPKLKKGELVPNSPLFGKRLNKVLDMLSSDQGVLL
uniref:Nucleolar MIF4G domain-containing protein 1 homolog n=1 Tax=Hirondellea gigas TaxID=1518452 RepID=A0A2P2I419_9CRUS